MNENYFVECEECGNRIHLEDDKYIEPRTNCYVCKDCAIEAFQNIKERLFDALEPDTVAEEYFADRFEDAIEEDEFYID